MLSGHNAYWMWGPGQASDHAVLVVDALAPQPGNRAGIACAAPAAGPSHASGTTHAAARFVNLRAWKSGHPKGAMQSHRAVYLNTAALFSVQARTDRDVLLNALPLPHVYGNVVMNGAFLTGAALVMMERFDPAAALAQIQRHRATVSTACRPCTR